MKKVWSVCIIAAVVLVAAFIGWLFFSNRGYEKVVYTYTETAYMNYCRIRERKGTWEIRYTFDGVGYSDHYDGKVWEVKKVEELPNVGRDHHTVFRMDFETGGITVTVDDEVEEELTIQTATMEDLHRIAMTYLRDPSEAETLYENQYDIFSDTYRVMASATENGLRVYLSDRVSDLSFVLEDGKITEVRKIDRLR